MWLLNFFYYIWDLWWVNWSNFRFRKCIRFGITLNPTDIINPTVAEINSMVRRLYKKFNYTNDDISQLGDAVLPPPQAYHNYNINELRDDCDGFHSLVLHCLRMNNIESYLLVVSAKKSGHCVLIFRLHNLWHVIDYTTVHKGYKSLKEAIDTYNIDYVEIYNAPSKVKHNSIVNYNYDKGKFKLINYNKFVKENS